MAELPARAGVGYGSPEVAMGWKSEGQAIGRPTAQLRPRGLALAAAIAAAVAAVLAGTPSKAAPLNEDRPADLALEPPPLPAEVTPAQVEPCPRRWPVAIQKLKVVGLWRTQERTVLGELPWKPGELVQETAWKLGEARLWNLGLFSRVELRLACQGDQTQAEIALEERWTINPLFSFQALAQREAKPGESSSWWTLGISDINIAGRRIEVAGLYSEFNGIPGGQLYGRLYNLAGLRMDALLQAERLVRPRPGFDDQRTLLRGELTRQGRDDRLRVAVRLQAQANQFGAAEGPPVALGAAKTALAELGVRLGRVDVARIRQVGQSLELRPGVAWTDQAGRDTLVHGQIWLHALAYLAPGERWNLALRLQLAAQTQAPAHLQWFTGGLYEVRGVRDSYARSRAYALINAEARWTLYDSTWLAVVPAAFADAAALRDADRGPLLLASVGAGVRLLAPRFVQTGLRIDLAQPLADMPCSGERWGPLCPGLSVGVYQYF
jgi:hypothetical protein